MINLKKHKIHLDKRHLDVANEFADKRCKDSNLYQRRGGFKRDDILTGALGEMGVYKFLKINGIKLDKPDFEIYARGEKTYSPDLPTKCGNGVHVKSQNVKSAELYGLSYLMQKSDPVLKAPSKHDFLAPCLVDLDELTVTLYGIIGINHIIDKNLLGEPVVPFLRHNKVAIYLESLKELSAKQRWRLV